MKISPKTAPLAAAALSRIIGEDKWKGIDLAEKRRARDELYEALRAEEARSGEPERDAPETTPNGGGQDGFQTGGEA